MFANLPPEKRRRMFALYIAVTILGACAVIVLLLLWGMLHWMNAEVPLPAPARLIHPDATSYWTVRIVGPIEEDSPLLSLASDTLPSSISMLVRKGIGDGECPVEAVYSALSPREEPAAALCVSLGRFPGLFRVVRKEMERRVENGGFDANIVKHGEQVVFLRASGALRALSLAKCTLLQATDQRILNSLLDRLSAENAPPSSRPTPAEIRAAFPDKKAELCGWAQSWPEFARQGIPGVVGPADWQGFVRRTGAGDGNALTQGIRDIRLVGQLTKKRLYVTLDCHPGSAANGTALAQALPAQLAREKAMADVKAVFDAKTSRLRIEGTVLLCSD